MTKIVRKTTCYLLVTCFLLPCNALPRHEGIPVGEEYHLTAGSSIMLNCSQSGSPPVVTWINVTWILPDLTLIGRGHNNTPKDDYDTGFTLSDDGEMLLVDNLQPQWYGDYYCVVLHREPDFYVKKYGLNSSYYYAAELRRQYERTITMLALVSGTVMAVITLVFSAIIWCRKTRLYRQQKPDRKMITDKNGMSAVSSSGSPFPGPSKCDVY